MQMLKMAKYTLKTGGVFFFGFTYHQQLRQCREKKTREFLMFSGGIERDQLHEMS